MIPDDFFSVSVQAHTTPYLIFYHFDVFGLSKIKKNSQADVE